MPASRQARPAGQSPSEVHPQWPLTQTLPDWFAASQTAQSPPLPQALSTVPGWQVPSLQQPPWQIEWFASPHALSHWPVVVLQAMPIGQSPAPLHVHSPQLPPQPSSPHALPVQSGVQHTPNFAVGAFAHRRLQQLWLARQARPSGLQAFASASRYPPRVSTTAARRNVPRATCFIAPPGPRASNAGILASSKTRGRTRQSHRRGAASTGSVGRDRHTRPARDLSCGWRTPQPSTSSDGCRSGRTLIRSRGVRHPLRLAFGPPAALARHGGRSDLLGGGGARSLRLRGLPLPHLPPRSPAPPAGPEGARPAYGVLHHRRLQRGAGDRREA